MAHPFSMTTVLRRTPFRMLRWFLPDVGIKLNFDWDKLRTQDLPLVIAAYDQVPQEQKAAAEAAVRDIVSLAGQAGMAALREAAKLQGLPHLDSMFDAYSSAYCHAIWVWTQYREVFVQARQLLRVTNQAYFRKRTGLPLGEPPLTEDKLSELKTNLQVFFADKQKRGKVCTLESFEREPGRFYVAAYPDDRPVPYLEHKAGVLIPKIAQPVFEVVFDLDSRQGTLAVSAKLDKAVKEELEELFIRTVYGIKPPPLVPPQYDIAKLKDSQFRLVTETADCVSADISSLKLKWKDIKSDSTLTAYKEGNVFRSVAELLRDEKQNLENAEVRQATLRFCFKAKPGRRAGCLNAELTPARLTLGSQVAVRTEIILKYLKQWRITQ